MKIFLSYDSKQKDLALKVFNSLSHEGYDVFFDKNGLHVGSTYHSKLKEEIVSSELFLFLMTCRSVEKGRYTLTELKFAWEQWHKGEIIFLPICIEEVKDIPEYLSEITYFQIEGDIPAELLDRVSTINQDYTAWKKAVRGNNLAEFESYLSHYPEGYYANKAHRQIIRIESEKKQKKALIGKVAIALLPVLLIAGYFFKELFFKNKNDNQQYNLAKTDTVSTVDTNPRPITDSEKADYNLSRLYVAKFIIKDKKTGRSISDFKFYESGKLLSSVKEGNHSKIATELTLPEAKRVRAFKIKAKNYRDTIFKISYETIATNNVLNIALRKVDIPPSPVPASTFSDYTATLFCARTDKEYYQSVINKLYRQKFKIGEKLYGIPLNDGKEEIVYHHYSDKKAAAVLAQLTGIDNIVFSPLSNQQHNLKVFIK